MLLISNIAISLSSLGDAPLDPRLEPYRVGEGGAIGTASITFAPTSSNPYEDLYQFAVEELPKHGSYIGHAAVVEYDGLAYAFMAPSGTGKSTHIKLWIDTLGPAATVINGTNQSSAWTKPGKAIRKSSPVVAPGQAKRAGRQTLPRLSPVCAP